MSQHWPHAQSVSAQNAHALDIDSASSTVFVRNLSFDVDDRQLQQFFQDVGPIKRAFVVKDKHTDDSRGFGFVQYAIASDAGAAVEQYNNKQWLDRPLRVELAVQQKGADPVQREEFKKKSADSTHKQEMKEFRSKKKDIKQQIREQKQQHDVQEEKSRSQRQKEISHSDKGNTVVLISGLDKSVDEKEIRNKCAKYGQVDQVMFPAPESGIPTKEKPATLAARVTFTEYRDAKTCIDRMEKVAKYGLSRLIPTYRLLSQEATLKMSRLIIRNLPFKVTDVELTELFQKFGQVLDVRLPLDDKQHPRGFGFIQMDSYPSAVEAIKALNGQKIHNRAFSVDFTVPREHFQELQAQSEQIKQQSALAATPAPNKLSTSIKLEDVDDDNNQHQNKRQKQESGNDGNQSVQLQHVVKSEQDEELITKTKQQIKNQESDDDDEDEFDTSNYQEADDETNGAQESELVYTPDQGGDDEDDQDEDEDDEEEEDSKAKKHTTGRPVSDVDQGKTIFIRNLSYDTTEDDLYNKFSTFGRLMMVKIVRDKVLNRSMGTAFIKFREREVVDELLANHSGAKVDKKEAKRRKHQFASLLNESAVRLSGRDLILSLAVDRNAATTLRQESERKSKDKRNLYLAKEGVITPESEAAQGVSKSDLEKRQRGWQEKRTKLRNPNFSVSATRLSFRNIPYSTTEKQLRQLVYTTVVQQLKKQGEKAGTVALKQVKIERDATKFDKEGLPKSRGYGFVEFRAPEHSLICLRQLNNNPTIFNPNQRPIVEFALEDARKLLVHRKRTETQHSRQLKTKDVQKDAEAAALAMLSGAQSTTTSSSLEKEILEAQKPKQPQSNRRGGNQKPQKRKAATAP